MMMMMMMMMTGTAEANEHGGGTDLKSEYENVHVKSSLRHRTSIHERRAITACSLYVKSSHSLTELAPMTGVCYNSLL